MLDTYNVQLVAGVRLQVTLARLDTASSPSLPPLLCCVNSPVLIAVQQLALVTTFAITSCKKQTTGS